MQNQNIDRDSIPVGQGCDPEIFVSLGTEVDVGNGSEAGLKPTGSAMTYGWKNLVQE